MDHFLLLHPRHLPWNLLIAANHIGAPPLTAVHRPTVTKKRVHVTVTMGVHWVPVTATADVHCFHVTMTTGIYCVPVAMTTGVHFSVTLTTGVHCVSVTMMTGLW